MLDEKQELLDKLDTHENAIKDLKKEVTLREKQIQTVRDEKDKELLAVKTEKEQEIR